MIKSIRKNQDLWAYLFLSYAAFILLYPVVGSREYSFCINYDNVHQAYPWFNKLASSLHKGYLPLWDANTYGGKNFPGDLIAGIFYPLNIVWCLLFGSVNGIDVYYLDILVAFHFFVCLIGMYRVGRVFNLTPVAAIATALIFTFTGAVAARAGAETCIFFGLSLMPWVIYFVGKYYMGRPKRRYFVFSGVFGGMQILAGHVQPFVHTLIIAAVIITFYEYARRKNWRAFALSIAGNFLLILLVSVIFSFPQVYYSVEYLSNCYRWVGGDYFIQPGTDVPLSVYESWYILGPANLGNLFARHYVYKEDSNSIYMGILPLFLLAGFLWKYKLLKMSDDHSRLMKWLLIVMIVGILSALGYLTFFHFLLYKIPLLNSVRQLGRYVILISFSCSLIIGLAITYLSGLKQVTWRKHSKTALYVLLALSLNGAYLCLFQRKYVPISVSIPFLFGFLFMVALIRVKKAGYLPITAVAIICLDLFLNPVNYLATSYSSYPPVYYVRNRVINFLETTYGKYRVSIDMKDYNVARKNIGDIYNIQTKSGFGATVNKEYFDFINFQGASTTEIDDLLNIKYIITDKTPDSNFIFKDSVQNYHLYERINCYPRVYWKRQLGQQGRDIEAQNIGKIRQLAYSDLYQKIEIDCSTADSLVFSENYYPGWKCYDNQKEIKISRAAIKNYPPLFRCIFLDKGHHIVEFKYNKVFYWF